MSKKFKPESVKFMEFLRLDLEHNPNPVKLWAKRLRSQSVRRSPEEIDRIRGVYVDWLIKLENYNSRRRKDVKE